MDRIACDRMFVEVMEQGSFTAAARRLGTSSGQASKLVARLEENLGVQLLTRTTRALTPTDAGRTYYKRMRVLLEERDALEAQMRQNATGAQGRLRLSLPITFGARVLAPMLAEFAESHPAIAIDAEFSDRLVNIVDDGFDAVFRIAAPEDSSLVMRRLCDIRILTVASPDYIARHGVPKQPEDLSQHQCVLDGNLRTPGSWTYRAPGTDQPLRIGVSGRVQFANAEAAAQAAVAGLGINRGPDFVLEPLIQSGQLVPVLEDWEMTPLSLAILYPDRRHVPGKLRALIDDLVSRFQKRDKDHSLAA